MNKKTKNRQQIFLTALKSTFPIAMGYIPVGFAYGVLAQKIDMSFANTLLMSLIVYAGSAQLIGVGLFEAAIAPFSIILTTFIVNLRHVLMSAALSPYMSSWPKRRLALFCFELTDETFALHSRQFPHEDFHNPNAVNKALYINLQAHSFWVLGSWLGFSAGTLIPSVRPFGLDFALPAMFIALLVVQIKNLLHLLIALFAGAMSVLLLVFGCTQWNVIIATVLSAALGAILETYRTREKK